MAGTKEALVKTKIKKILKEHGVYYAMPMGTGYGNSGVPDFLCCIKGKFLAVEAKAGKGDTTALQKKNIREIENAGGDAWVVRESNLENFEAYIKEFGNE
jgi:Holliday junction resolvase